MDLLKKGDKKAFHEIVETYYARLCAYAFNYVHVTQVSEDMVSDLLLHIWEKREKIAITASIQAYLFRGIHNACLNYIKLQQSRYVATDFSVVSDYYQEEYRIHEQTTPMDYLISDELSEQINSLIEALPGQCREIFRLSRLNGLKNDEIARQLGLSHNTVKVQIFRALNKLRKGLPEYL